MWLCDHVCTYREYTGNGIMKRLMIQGLTQMHKEGKSFALLYPYSIPLYHHLGWEIISTKISYNIKDRQIPTKVSAPRLCAARRLGQHGVPRAATPILPPSPTGACSATHWPGRSTGAGTRMTPMSPSIIM